MIKNKTSLKSIAASRKSRLSLIGWREWVGFPELGIKSIKAKVDTGARSSSIHAFNVESYRRKGKQFVRFDIHPVQRSTKKVIEAHAEVLEWRNVRSSSGKASLRPVIVTEVKFLGETWPIEVTLANRDEMGFRVLLGREAVRGRHLVDPGRSFYAGKPKKKKTVGKTKSR